MRKYLTIPIILFCMFGIGYANPFGTGSWGTGADVSGDITVDNITVNSGGKVLLPQEDDEVNPTLAFGDGDSGIYERTDDEIVLSFIGIGRWSFTNNIFGGFENGASRLIRSAATGTSPGFAFRADGDTGIGRAADDELSLIAGGVQAANIDANGQINFLLINDPSSPTLAFGDGDSGIYQPADDEISLSLAGAESVRAIGTAGGTKIKTAGDAPVLSACGTTPVITGSDTNGKITIGTGATTSCTVTFDSTFTAAPACVVTGEDSAVTYAATTTATVLTITSSADMNSDVVMYICLGIL